MIKVVPDPAPEHPWQERRLGRTIVRTYRTTVDLDDVLPNPKQPRLGLKEDPELQRQIEANEGLFEPLLLEPHPTLDNKYQIIDGDRRWTNSRVLVKEHNKEQYLHLPAEITDHTLGDEERLRVWIYIHRQRKEWDAKEKEMVLRAASSTSWVRGERSEHPRRDRARSRQARRRLPALRASEEHPRSARGDHGGARDQERQAQPSWHRRCIDTIVAKINEKLITNSKDVRRLRAILGDPVAKDCFLAADHHDHRRAREDRCDEKAAWPSRATSAR